MRSEKDENHDGVTFSCVKRTEHSFFKNTFFFLFFYCNENNGIFVPFFDVFFTKIS